MKKKIISAILAGAMVLSLAACGGSQESLSVSEALENEATEEVEEEAEEADSEEEATEVASEVDTSERVDLVFYVMGDAPEDEKAVEDALNEKLLEKVNATVDFQFSTWTDFQQKYSLELTSGAADLIYIANWLDFGKLAKDGAFVELDDLLEYTPELKETVGEDALNMCSVEGSVYAIPNTWAEYVSNGIKYREDLRVKYDLPVPDSLENLEAYLLGIKENEPNQGLLTVTTEESTGLQVAFDAAWALSLKYPWVTVRGLSYGLTADYETPNDVYDYWFSDDFVDDANLMKKWADLGFWSRSALSDTNNSESFKLGLCVAEVAGQNPSKYITAVNDLAAGGEGWEAAYYAYGEATGVIFPGHATQNGTAIVRGSKNPERAMLVLEQLMCDQEINNLVQAGIEGTHYDMVDGLYNNDNYMKEDGSSAFPYEGFNTWNLRNGDYKLDTKDSVALQEMFDEYEVLGSKTKFPNVDIYSGFVEDDSEYAAEKAAVSQVMRQYLAPIQAGLVDDVDKAVEEFRTKVKEAGLDACRTGYEAQWHAYCEEYGYK